MIPTSCPIISNEKIHLKHQGSIVAHTLLYLCKKTKSKVNPQPKVLYLYTYLAGKCDFYSSAK